MFVYVLHGLILSGFTESWVGKTHLCRFVTHGSWHCMILNCAVKGDELSGNGPCCLCKNLILCSVLVDCSTPADRQWQSCCCQRCYIYTQICAKTHANCHL